MKIEKKLNKIYAGALAIMMITLVFSSVFAVRTITDSSDTIETQIRNSKGNSWAATGANLQLAIYDLNSTVGGKVNVPQGTITLTTTLYVPRGIWIDGCGNSTTIYLSNSVNKTMIQSHPSSTGQNIKITNLRINGNNANQPVWWHVGARTLYAHGIYLVNADNALLENLYITNTQSCGILIDNSENVTVNKCWVMNAGSGYQGSGYTHWWAKGIFYQNCNHSTITNCFVNYSYAGCIVVEAIFATVLSEYNHDVLISDCNVGYSEIGYYIEHCKDSVISHCSAVYCTDDDVYNGGVGFDMLSTTQGIVLDSCIASYCGATSHDAASSNFIINGKNSQVSNCVSLKSNAIGFNVFGEEHTLIGCRANSDYSFGYYSEADQTLFSACTANNSGNDGFQILATAGGVYTKIKWVELNACVTNYTSQDGVECWSYNTSIIGCQFHSLGGRGINLNAQYCIVDGNKISGASADGIYLPSPYGNNTLTGNYVYNCADGFDVRSQNNSLMGNIIRTCTNGIDEGTGAGYNLYLGNNAWACTNDYDINTVTYLPYPQVNFSNFNRGIWT